MAVTVMVMANIYWNCTVDQSLHTHFPSHWILTISLYCRVGTSVTSPILQMRTVRFRGIYVIAKGYIGPIWWSGAWMRIKFFLTKSKNTRTWGQGYPLKFTREKLRTNNGQPHFTQRVKNLRNGLPLHKCFLLVLGAVGDAKVIRLCIKFVWMKCQLCPRKVCVNWQFLCGLRGK